MRLDALVGGSVDVVGPEASLRSAASLMVGAGTGAVAVVDRRELVGILTDRDLARAAADGADFDTEANGRGKTFLLGIARNAVRDDRDQRAIGLS